MTERDTFIRAIAEAWDDPTPVLVFADWAEEHGTDDPPLLRWYGWHVMPALAAVPPKCGRTTNGDRDRAAKAVCRHPQKDVLFRCAAVAFCRRPAVWDGDEKDAVRPAVGLCRMLALGLADDTTRDRNFRRANDAANALSPLVEAADAADNFTLVDQLENRIRANLIVGDLLTERPHVTRSAIAHRTATAAGPGNTAAERSWQAAVYAALAAVPPLVVDELRPPDVERVREIEMKELPPMKLPRGKFRRIVVRGRAYGWMARVDYSAVYGMPGVYEVLVRSADNTGQRLRVRPAPHTVLPSFVAKAMADALDGGWRPTENDLPDFVWDTRSSEPGSG